LVTAGCDTWSMRAAPDTLPQRTTALKTARWRTLIMTVQVTTEFDQSSCSAPAGRTYYGLRRDFRALIHNFTFLSAGAIAICHDGTVRLACIHGWPSIDG